MARRLRLQFPGARYHIINRGNFRQAVFSTAGAGQAFGTTLDEAAERFRWRLHAYTRAVEAILASRHSPEMLRIAMFSDGFLVRTDTLAPTIMRRLVREGVAVIVHTP